MFDQLPAGSNALLDNFQLMQSYAYAIMGDKERAKSLLEETQKNMPQRGIGITEPPRIMLLSAISTKQ